MYVYIANAPPPPSSAGRRGDARQSTKIKTTDPHTHRATHTDTIPALSPKGGLGL